MKFRIGKIARLPLAIRNELNTRLSEGDPSHLLIEWLNTDPAVLAVLNAQFDGQLISEADISRWRQGGYMEWALVRECAATARGLSESSEEIAVTGIKAEHLLTVLTCQYARILNEWEKIPDEELNQKLNILKKLTNAALALRRREFQAARLELDRDRHELAREKQLSKSASSTSSRASASTESTGAPRKKAPRKAASQNDAQSHPADPGHPVPASSSSYPSATPASRFSLSDVRPPTADLRSLSQDLRPPLSDFLFASSRNRPAILSGPLCPAPAPGVVQMINASLARSGPSPIWFDRPGCGCIRRRPPSDDVNITRIPFSGQQQDYFRHAPSASFRFTSSHATTLLGSRKYSSRRRCSSATTLGFGSRSPSASITE